MKVRAAAGVEQSVASECLVDSACFSFLHGASALKKLLCCVQGGQGKKRQAQAAPPAPQAKGITHYFKKRTAAKDDSEAAAATSVAVSPGGPAPTALGAMGLTDPAPSGTCTVGSGHDLAAGCLLDAVGLLLSAANGFARRSVRQL